MRGSFIKKALEELESSGLKRVLRRIVHTSPRECEIDGVRLLNFSSNDYLGLSAHPEVVEESARWTKKYGAGAGASRLVTGTLAPCEELEERIAAWKKCESALILGSGYMANTGIIPALADRSSVIFGDKLNHASLNAGCRLSDAAFRRIPHNDFRRLEKALSEEDEAVRKLIVWDTIFSMDGDVADIDALKELADRHDALLYLDDAHAGGIFGENGCGLASGDGVDICMGTFSKALGSYGAYAACDSETRDYLVNKCGSLVYSTALPPGVCGAVSAAVGLVQTPEYREKSARLLRDAETLREEIVGMGYDTGSSESQIIPVVVGEPSRAVELSRLLLGKGVLAVAIRPPTVPANTARVRISINACHTRGDFDRLLDALKSAASKVL